MSKVDDFLQIVDDIYGLYLDAVNAIWVFRKKFVQFQEENSIKLGKSIEELDLRKQTFGKGEPFEGKELHSCTQGEFKERTKKNGKDSYLIARLCVVMIYNYWEDYFRQEIAKESGKIKNEITSDIMGDLKHFRQSIIHHSGTAKKEIGKAKILKWFREGQKININEEQFEEIVDEIKKGIEVLRKKNTSSNTG
ncbi:MAG: hypothetical protein WC505_04400 [Patescibacteria group bacterium]